MIFVSRQYVALALAISVGLIALGTFWLSPESPEVPPAILTEEVGPKAATATIIGHSVAGRSIEAYTYGTGDKHVVFVGGIHGGYEWNSVLLAYDMMELFIEDPTIIPEGVKVTVIPAANPDGLYQVIPKEGRITWNDAVAADASGVGRMNANGVDLNRNFDCKWQPKSTWRGTEVSAGTAAFSEPEAVAIRDFALSERPNIFVFWHSQANAVYASECEAGILPETLAIMNAYAAAADYQAIDSFDAYPVTGDAEGWLASIGIPAITVELSTHTTTDWQRNVAGVRALFERVTQ